MSPTGGPPDDADAVAASRDPSPGSRDGRRAGDGGAADESPTASRGNHRPWLPTGSAGLSSYPAAWPSRSAGLASYSFAGYAGAGTPRAATPAPDGTCADRTLPHGLRLLTSQQEELKGILRALERGQGRIHEHLRSIHEHLRELGGNGAGAPAGEAVEGRSCQGSPTAATEPLAPLADPPPSPFCGPSPSPPAGPRRPSWPRCASGEWSYCGFEVRPTFQGVPEGRLRAPGASATLEGVKRDLDVTLRPTLRGLTQSMDGARDQSVLRRFLPRINPIHPDSGVRLWIDVAVIFVLVFDSMSVPFQLSFKPDATSGFFFVTNWMTMFFWTVDLCVGFMTGYYENGRVVMNFRSIARRYLRTFFPIDIFAVGCDWLSTVVLTIFADGRSDIEVAFVKLLRILKLNRLFRLAAVLQTGKLGQIYDRILNVSRKRGLAQQLQFVLSITQLTFSILWLNHIGCCMWFTIGSDATEHWMDASELAPESHESIQWEYMLGFYWAMTSMVSGSSIIVPTNVNEMKFTILYVLFGLLVGSTLISSLAAMLLDIQMTNKGRRDSMRLLRQYLYQEDVEVGLSLAVEQEALRRISQKRQLGANEVDCLQLLSPELRSALNYATHSRPLKQHSFFGACHVIDRAGRFTKEICEGAVQHHIEDPGAQVFGYDDVKLCEGPYYIVLGQFEYRARDEQGEASMVAVRSWSSRGSSLADQGRPVLVGSGQWLCEMAMWLKWRHRGSLDACVPCEFFQLVAQELLHTLAQHADLLLLAHFYAHALCKTVQTESSGPLTDLPLQDVVYQVLVRSMPQCGRQVMSMAAVKLLQDQRRAGYLSFGRWPLKQLVDEVEQGQCDLVIRRGRVLRVVSVVALWLEREVVTKSGEKRRQILARLGKTTSREHARCQLPGSKVKAGELPSDALARVLRGELAGLRLAGLLQEDLQKVDNTVELTQDADRGSRHLRVSLLADLCVGSLVQVDGVSHLGAVSETQEVAAINFDTLTVEIRSSLRHSYPAGTRVTPMASASVSAQADVHTRYIRSVFRGRMLRDLPADAMCQLRRSGSNRTDPSVGRHDPTDYDAFVLLFDPGRSTAAAAEAPAASASGRRAAGRPRRPVVERAPYAWVWEEDFMLLSATPLGQGLVQDWVAQLEAAAEEDEERLGCCGGEAGGEPGLPSA